MAKTKPDFKITILIKDLKIIDIKGESKVILTDEELKNHIKAYLKQAEIMLKTKN